MSKQVVKENIPWGGVWAYTRGQVIDSEVVESNGWQDYVVGENTKEAREVRRSVGVETGVEDSAAAKPAAKTESKG